MNESKWSPAQINALIAQGMSVDEIAAHQGVSHKTAANRMRELHKSGAVASVGTAGLLLQTPDAEDPQVPALRWQRTATIHPIKTGPASATLSL